MPLKLSSTAPGTNTDYIRYLDGAPRKTDKMNDPDVLEFAVIPFDASFVKLTRGNYITFDSVTYPNWFTGYVINDPELEYIGKDASGNRKYGFKYIAVSDDVLLNLNPLGLMPAFRNTTMGAILKALANSIAPGVFNVTGINDGPKVAYYQPDPTKKFSDIAKEFADSAAYRFWAKAGNLYFAEITGSPLTVDGNDKHFTPQNLTIKVSDDPLVNDVVVLGQIEPQNYITEYFAGDGGTARFPMMATAYGVAKMVLLDEVFQSLDTTTKWTVADGVNNWLRVVSGFLNCVGGNNTNSFDTYIQSKTPLPMEGNLRVTHGEYDFVSASDGMIGSLWTGAPVSSYAGCLFGIRAQKSGSNTILNPVVAGVLDSSQQFLITDYNKRYVVRTVIGFKRMHRLTQSYAYVDPTGTVGSYGGTTADDTAYMQTWITTIDPTTGATVSQVVWTHSDVVCSVNDFVAFYTPMVSNDLHATVTGITISQPLQAQLDVKNSADPTYYATGGGADITGASDQFTYAYQSFTGNVFGISARVRSIQNTNVNAKAGLMIRQDTSAGSPYFAIFISPTSGVIMQWRETQGGATSTSGWKAGITAPYYLAINRSQGKYGGGYSLDGQTWYPLLPTASNPSSSARVSLSIPDSALVGIAVTAGNNNLLCHTKFDSFNPAITLTGVDIGSPLQKGIFTSTWDWTRKLVGPNEIDAQDGMAPTATIIQQEGGMATKSTESVVSSYNPGQAMLEFFKDTALLDSDVPQPGDIIRLVYRRAAPSFARVQERNSIGVEADAWGDAGVRSMTRNDIKPTPRTSEECEAAAAAIVADLAFQHYDGTYVQWSNYSFTGEPLAGQVLQFANVAEFPNLQAELITQVVTSLESKSGGVERFLHNVQFGAVDHVRQFIDAQEQTPVGVTMPEDTALQPDPVSISAVGNTTLRSVEAPWLSSWDVNYFHVNTGQDAPSGGGFEVRYTDEGWGADAGKNLITRTTARTFSVPRTARGRMFFIRAYDSRNWLLYSEDLTQSAWVASSASVSNVIALNPDNKKDTISQVAFNASAAAQVYQDLSVPANGRTALFVIDVNGTEGNQIRLVLQTTTGEDITTSTVTLTGGWQRVNILHTFTGGSGGAATAFRPNKYAPNEKAPNFTEEVTGGVTGNIRVVVQNGVAGTAQNVKVTRANCELAATSEAIYCKTLATPYGALSKYSAGIHVGLPMVPLPPAATVDATYPTAPVISAQLPFIGGDVWGVEVRASDNATVLYKATIADAIGDSIKYTINHNTTRTLDYYLYCFNLLGEYSTALHLQFTIPTPTVTSVSIDDATKRISMQGIASKSFLIECDATDANLLHPVWSKTSVDQYYAIPDADFFPTRWFRVTPYDELGPGNPQTVSHGYTPSGVIEWNGNIVQSVPVPASPIDDPVVTTPYGSKFQRQIVDDSWSLYSRNKGRYNPL